MTGDERAMERINEHDELLHKQVLPDIESLKKITLNHEEKMKALEENQKEYNLQQTALKNDVQGVNLAQGDLKLTIQQMGQDLKDQNNKLFDHVLGINTIKAQNEGAVEVAKTQQSGAIKVSELSTRAQIIGGVLGAGGLMGLFLTAYTIYEKLTGG